MISRKRYNEITIEAVDYGLLGFGETLKHAFYCHFGSNYQLNRGDIPYRLRDFQEALHDSLGAGAKIVERLVARNLYTRIGLAFTEHGDWRLVDYAQNATKKVVVRIALGAQQTRLPGSIALILCLEQRYAGCYRPLLVICILVMTSCGAIFMGQVQADATTYHPSSSNILTGSLISGDMTSLVNVDANYYVVRSAGSATTTLPYTPSTYSLLGPTSFISGAISDLASNNGVYMTFRSYATQTSPTSMSRALIAYRSNTGASTTSSPKTRNWDGFIWDGTEAELPTVGSPLRWMRIAYSPLMARHYERILVTLSTDGYLDAYVWTGSTWQVSNDIGFVGAAASEWRAFDVAYEKTSGKAILVYTIHSTDPAEDLAYRIWDGFTWSTETYINDSEHTSEVQYYWVALASKTASGANEISLIALEGTTSGGSVRAWIWDGVNWGNELSLETNTIKTKENIAVAYESISGYAMFVWGDDASNRYDSRRWLGSSWEGTERIAISSLSGDPGWVSLKSDPTSNRIMLLSIDSALDLWTADWNPTTWTTHSIHDNDVDFGADRCADGDWEPNGSKYLMVYGTNSGSLATKSWTTASGWSAVGSVTATGTHHWIQLRRNPRDITGDVKILGAMLNSNLDIGALKWDGTSLANIGDSVFTAAVGASKYECFDLRFQLFGDPAEYTNEVELTGSSNSYAWAQIVWTIDTAWTEADITVTIQLYNYNSASYPSSGDGCLSYTSSGTPNTDETKTQTITNNLQYYRDGSGNWKAKIKGAKATGIQFDLKVDWIEYKTTYHSEYAASTEFLFSGIADDTLTLLVFTVVSQYDIGSVSVMIQVWNYNTGQYVTSGEGYLSYTSSATPSTDETTILAITTNTSYYISSGNARIKTTGVKATTTQFQQKTNQIKLDYIQPTTTTLTTTTTTTATTTTTQTTTTTTPTTDTTTTTLPTTTTTTTQTITTATATMSQTTSITVPTTTTTSVTTTTTATTTTSQETTVSTTTTLTETTRTTVPTTTTTTTTSPTTTTATTTTSQTTSITVSTTTTTTTTTPTTTSTTATQTSSITIPTTTTITTTQTTRTTLTTATTTTTATLRITTAGTITVSTTLTIMGLEHITHTVISISSTTTSVTVTSLRFTTATVTTSTTTLTTTSTSITITERTTSITTTTETIPAFLAGRCVIASAAYGSELAPEVQFLRAFRDRFVESTFAGGAFMKAFNAFYYSFSPAAAGVVAENPLLLQMVRLLLYPLMAVLHVASAIFHALIFAPELATIVSGTVASALVGVAYLSPLAAVMKIPARRGRRRNWK